MNILDGRAPDGTGFDLTGPAGAPVVALIHGLGLCREIWADILPILSDYRVLNYDLYGHGSSDAFGVETSLAIYANQLAGLMDHLSIPQAHVVGFSIGGMINRRFALDHAERLQSLVILNSPHERGADAQIQVEGRAQKTREEGSLATLPDALKRWFTPEYLASGDGPQKVRDWRIAVEPDSYANAAWVLAHGVRELTGQKGRINVPSLVITCENDSGSTTSMSHAIADEIDGSELSIIRRLKHLGLMEEPEIFGQLICDFLNRHHAT